MNELLIGWLIDWLIDWLMWLFIWMKLEKDAVEWDASKVSELKLCIIGACTTHVGYNLLSSILDGSIFDEQSYDIDIYLYDKYLYVN